MANFLTMQRALRLSVRKKNAKLKNWKKLPTRDRFSDLKSVFVKKVVDFFYVDTVDTWDTEISNKWSRKTTDIFFLKKSLQLKTFLGIQASPEFAKRKLLCTKICLKVLCVSQNGPKIALCETRFRRTLCEIFHRWRFSPHWLQCGNQ